MGSGRVVQHTTSQPHSAFLLLPHSLRDGSSGAAIIIWAQQRPAWEVMRLPENLVLIDVLHVMIDFFFLEVKSDRRRMEMSPQHCVPCFLHQLYKPLRNVWGNSQKGSAIDGLPPTQDALIQLIKRVTSSKKLEFFPTPTTHSSLMLRHSGCFIARNYNISINNTD